MSQSFGLMHPAANTIMVEWSIVKAVMSACAEFVGLISLISGPTAAGNGAQNETGPGLKQVLYWLVLSLYLYNVIFRMVI